MASNCLLNDLVGNEQSQMTKGGSMSFRPQILLSLIKNVLTSHLCAKSFNSSAILTFSVDLLTKLYTLFIETDMVEYKQSQFYCPNPNEQL